MGNAFQFTRPQGARRETCERLGLSGPEPETVPSASLSPAEKDIADAASRLGFTLEDLAEGIE